MVREPHAHELTWPTPEALVELIDELRLDGGYRIGTEQYIAAQDILLVCAARGDLADEPKRLQSLLGPLLCGSPREQEDFKFRFDRWVARYDERLAPPEPTPDEPLAPLSLERELQKVDRGLGVWRRLIVTAIVLIGMSLAFAALVDRRLDTLEDSSNVAVKVPTPAATPATTATRPPTPRITPKPVVPKPVVQTVTYVAWKKLVVYGVVLLLAMFIWWKIWWYYRAHLFLVRRRTFETPRIQHVSIEALDEYLFPRLPLLNIAQEMRRRIEVPSDLLDIDGTVEKTIQSGGLFSPAYRTLQLRPEYLALIDRTTFDDQQAKFVDELVDRLAKDEVLVIRYYFDGDPRTCFPEVPGETPLTLHQLVLEYPQHRLLLFSEAGGLFSSHSGELGPWFEYFLQWPDRVVLTPKAPEHWGHREEILAQHFIVLPASVEGLSALARSLRHGRALVNDDSVAVAPLPEELKVRPLRWLERDAPSDDRIERMLAEVRDYLGDDGYFWLSACAVYPELHWNLTVHLGRALQSEQQKPLLEPHGLTALTRLPWLRHGYMPDWLRVRLINDLPQEQEKKVRAALEDLLLSAISGSTDGYQMEIAREHRDSVSTLAKPLLRLLARKEPKDSPLREHVFQTFMGGRHQDPLAVRVPRAIGQALGNGRERQKKSSTQAGEHSFQRVSPPRIRLSAFGDARHACSHARWAWLGAAAIYFTIPVASAAFIAGPLNSSISGWEGIGTLIFVSLALLLLSLLTSVLLTGGLFRMATRQLAGGHIRGRDIFSLRGVFWKLCGAIIVLCLAALGPLGVGLGSGFLMSQYASNTSSAELFMFVGFAAAGVLMVLVAAPLLFTIPLVVDKRMGPIAAAGHSCEVLKGHYIKTTFFLILASVLYVSGTIFVWIGLLITLPWAVMSIAVLYRDFCMDETPVEVPHSTGGGCGLRACSFVLLGATILAAAILFPVFARARENARRASCQSNLKQIALGVKQYIQDYDEKYPPAKSGGSGNSSTDTYPPFGWADALQPYVKSTQIFQCPSEAANSDAVPRQVGYTDYFYNSNLSRAVEPAIEDVSSTVLGGDGAPGDAALAIKAFSDTDVAMRHMDSANFAYADGHVKWQTREAAARAHFGLGPAPNDPESSSHGLPATEDE